QSSAFPRTQKMNNRLFTFVGGNAGVWRIVKIETIVGEALPAAARVDVIPAQDAGLPPHDAKWVLHGITSNERYEMHGEKEQILAKQPELGRSEAVCAAFIPIRKNATWWSLHQDERQKIFEEQSRHARIGLQYLPAIARRLHHCRDLGEPEPFDFLTWFEFAPADEPAFNKLVTELRASPEWQYVEREIDIRLVREPT
ncbi:MAG: chlorite dismutase family protein, partial [Sulfuricella sp.]